MSEEYRPRRRRSAARETAASEPISERIKEPFRAAGARVGAGLKLANILLLLFMLFLMVSLYTPWTGIAGERISGLLLSTVGGAVIIPVALTIYFCLCALLSRRPAHAVRITTGLSLVFILLSLLLGLSQLTGERASLRFMDAGAFGRFVCVAVYRTTGVFGTLMIGLLLIYLALLAFGIHIFTYLKLPAIHLPAFRRKKASADRHSARGEAIATDCEEADTDDAPNIMECEDVKSYFDYEEATPDGDEENGESEDAPAGSEDDGGELPEEEGVDYNDPETIKDDDGQAVIQDPNFSLGDGKAKRVRQGIFPPPIEIFGPQETLDGGMDEEKAAPLGEKIVKTLAQFSIESHLAEILVGPTVIQFRIQLAPGIKVSKVAALANDIALAMAVPSLRIEAPIPGKPYVGIEIPNPKRRGIPLRTVIEDDGFQHTKLSLPLPFGVAVNGDSVIVGLEELPHLLVAGTTGSGKSVFINSCIVGLCSKRSPEELRMILVDPKRVEMAVYDRLPHLLTPPVTDPKKAVQALAWLIREMEDRYSTFAKIRVRNLEGYNEKVLPKDRLPHIVIVVDELADLMMTAAKEVEEYICRLAQMARATGIHLMLATQRPSVNIITGLIKANIPARVAFTLPSNADSRTIIDCAGAEKLLGKGDMLFLSTRHPKPVRIQSPWIDEAILSAWLAYMTNTFGEPDFIEIEAQGACNSGNGGSGNYDDEMLDEAIETVMSTGIASASGLQRRLRVGFSRASRLIDMMEQIGIVGPADGARPREILVDEEGAQELLDGARNE